MTHKIIDARAANDSHRLLPTYQPVLTLMPFPWLRIASSEPFSSPVSQTALPDSAWCHLLETHLTDPDGVQVEIPLPGLGRLQLSLTNQGQALEIDVTGGDPAAQNWLLQHRAPIERRLQAKTGRAMLFRFARGQRSFA